MNITAINVFVEIDGLQCIAPIDSDSAHIFIYMLAAHQKTANGQVKMVALPAEVAEHVIAARRAIAAAITKATGVE